MIAVVTGASRGIGLAIARKFYSAGYEVLCCSRNPKDPNALGKEFPGNGPGSLEFMAADLSDKKQAEAFAKWVIQKGTPAILVNNAGTYLPGDSSNEPDGNLEALMATNLYSAYWLTRELLPAMITQKNGHIFNICSIASLKAYPGGGGYSISKFALHGLTLNLRHELKKEGIKVTGVYPGAVLTDSWSGFDNSTHRIMEVADVADMIFTASQLSFGACVEEIVLRPTLGDL